jgi:hypothetical protein
MSSLERLRALLGAEPGLLAQSLVEPEPGDAQEAFGPLAASGACTRAAAPDYALLVESILEGYLVHFACGRIVAPGDDDLRLLAGDHLYAFGLARLAELGDLDAVEELADLISLCAHVHAHAAENGASAWPTTAALWALAALAVADGAWREQRESKESARRVQADAASEALAAARERAAALGVERNLDLALIAFDVAVSRVAPTT